MLRNNMSSRKNSYDYYRFPPMKFEYLAEDKVLRGELLALERTEPLFELVLDSGVAVGTRRPACWKYVSTADVKSGNCVKTSYVICPAMT